ncbi:MAG: hypothetical protein ACI4P0_02140, partial [Mailhella sp.]
MPTKGAIGNLISRYRAVLKKCSLINTFGSLAVASMLVFGSAYMAVADSHTVISDTTTQGGAVFNDNDVSGETDADNKNYGGRFLIKETGNLSFTAPSVTFSGNKAQYGGAIAGFGDLKLAGGTLSNNTAKKSGGAIYCRATPGTNNPPIITLDNVIFTGNKANPDNDTSDTMKGGAIYNEGYQAYLTNVTFNNNTSSTIGGAVFNHEPSV